jgi:MFS family permease
VRNRGSNTLLSRRLLAPRAAYVLMASVIGLALFASGTPSPLYGTYRAIWSLSPLVLTLVYATYAFGVLTTLLLAGPVSDYVGRRPVLLVALGSLMAATVMFMLADSVAWLFAARAVQGLATGLALSAASAALLDLHPRRDAGAVGLHNGIASAGGMGLGVLTSAAIVELLPAPRVLPYVAAFVLFVIAFAGTLAMAEPVSDPVGLRLHPQRPGVPAAVRLRFCSPLSACCPRGRSEDSRWRSGRSSWERCFTRPTNSSAASACSRLPERPRSRNWSFGAALRGPPPPGDRWRWPPVCS